jgi:hypothetical protein
VFAVSGHRGWWQVDWGAHEATSLAADGEPNICLDSSAIRGGISLVAWVLTGVSMRLVEISAVVVTYSVIKDRPI